MWQREMKIEGECVCGRSAKRDGQRPTVADCNLTKAMSMVVAPSVPDIITSTELQYLNWRWFIINQNRGAQRGLTHS